MELQEKINSIAERKYPIRYHSGPGYEKDCRHKIARKEMLQELTRKMLWGAVSKLIGEHKGDSPAAIAAIVNEYLNSYPSEADDNY